MKCPYPDCTGQVTLGEQFCGECGRALTWENGQPRPAGAAPGASSDPGATRVMSDVPPSVLPPPPPPTTPGGGGIYNPSAPTEAYPVQSGAPQPGGSSVPPYTAPMGATPPMGGTPPPYTPPMGATPPPTYTAPMAATPPPTYTAPMGTPPPAAPARRGPNPVLLVVVGGVAGIVLLCVACFALGVFSSLLSGTATPTTAPPPTRVTLNPAPTATLRSLGRATSTTGTVENTPVLPSDTPILPEDTPVPTDATPGAPTPDAAATAAASDFDLDFTDYSDASGADVVVGKVHNKGSDRLENVKVTAELLDANGNTVGTGDDIMLPLAIMEGDQTLPFQVRITSPGEGAERIHVQVHADVYDATGFHIFDPAQKLAVEGTTLGKGALGPNITGRVRNDGSKAATLVNVIAAGYDADGKLVDTGTAYLTSDVEAGTTSPFELMFLRPDVEITKFDIWVLGQEKP